MKIEIKLLNDKAKLPEKMSQQAAGYDIYACLENDINLLPLQRVLISAGFSLALPSGYEAQIRSRSGLAINHGVVVLNSPGTIDADYRGEVKVILINLSDKEFIIKNEMRVAQMVINKHEEAVFQIVEVLGETLRGDGGFGSS